MSRLIAGYVPALGLKGFGVWDGNQIRTYLDSYSEIRKSFSTLITSNEVLAKVLADMSAPTPPLVIQAPDVRIRPGQPGLEAVFGPVYEAAGGTARFGRALGEVAEHAPGWVQHFEGGQRGEPAVLCSADGRTAVAMARSVWNDLYGIGGGAPGAGTIGAGFPAPDATAPGRFIGSDSVVVELAAGTWGTSGRGQLVRSTSGPARWQPKIAFDRAAFRDRDVWAAGFTDKRDLRLRVAARLPLMAEEWRITRSDRARMLAALDSSGLAEVVGRLAERYDLHHTGVAWAEIEPPDGINNSRFTAHQLVVHGAGGRPALAACARLVLPDGLTNDVRTTLDLRVDFSAIEPSLDSTAYVQIPAPWRLTVTDLTAFFVHAWHTATTVLPLVAAENPLDLPPSGAPRLELYVQSERPGDHGHDRVAQILDMIDFGPLGTARHEQLRELSIAVTTPLSVELAVIEQTITDALVRMTEDAGFTPAVVVHP